MSLQRRLLIYLLVCAPLVWTAALTASIYGARQGVNEPFDTELIRLARQVQVLLHSTQTNQPDAARGTPLAMPRPEKMSSGGADLQDMAIAVWDAKGQLVLADREGSELPRHDTASGFVNDTINGQAWRLYYLKSPNGEWVVAAGQKADERDDLVFTLTATQLLPWLLVLPVLLLTMAWAVRRALKPVHEIATELQQRDAYDLKPVTDSQAPTEIKPLLRAMNSLFSRIEGTLMRERRFTADAAHELRTPLAVLRA